MTDTPEDQAARNVVMERAIASIKDIANDCMNVCSNIIDRLSQGNLRLLKDERKEIMEFMAELPTHLGAMIATIDQLQSLRLQSQTFSSLVAQHDKLRTEVLDTVIHMLEDGDDYRAFLMLRRIRNRGAL